MRTPPRAPHISATPPRVATGRLSDAFRVLRTYLDARASLNDQEFNLIASMFVEKNLHAREFLQRAGVVAKYAAFVAKGCLRSYVIDSSGKEHIVQFAPETWWLADAMSLENGTPAQYFFDAIEESQLLLIDPSSHDRLVAEIPEYGASFRRGLQRHAAAKDRRIVVSMSASAEERYVDFLKTYPTIASRVPQRMLASYLGVSPETVSRIRRKLSQR